MEGDLDNIVKPILDALSNLIYVDDAQVERILVQRFEPGRIATFSGPSPKLAEAVAKSGPRLYIKVDVPRTEEFADD
jgi:crossover junction endodeoxyribonuclease RusA